MGSETEIVTGAFGDSQQHWLDASPLSLLPIFGTGDYRVQPVFVGDLASLAIASAEEEASSLIDAIGPETFSFKEMVRLMAAAMKRNVKVIVGSHG